MDLTTVTVQQFKARFYRDFSYKSVDQEIVDRIPDNDFVEDQDITNAFADAQALINQGLFPNDSVITTAYLYLTAHCLCLNIQASDAGINSSPDVGNLVAGRSGGSLAESYSIPQAYLDDPILAQYCRTIYGQKYLAFVLPYLRGNMTSVFGGSHP